MRCQHSNQSHLLLGAGRVAAGSDGTPDGMDDGYMKDQHVMVTGASGFIGRWLCKRLREFNYKVTGLSQRDGDISQKDYFEKYANLVIDHVFHLASRTFVPNSWEDPSAFYTTNVIGTLNILEFCRKKKIPITFVSAYVYGPQESQPISESVKIQPTNPYAHSKYLAEQLCEFYADTFSVACTIIRPFNVYGHGQSEEFLIPTILNQALHSSEIRVKNIWPRRDYLYIQDLIDILVLTLKKKDGFSIYNAGSGSSLSVSDVIGIIQKLCNKSKNIVSENTIRKSELAETIADIAKLKRDFGWIPKYTFESGIADMLTARGMG